MTNMSYCRFQNTLEELKVCEDYMDAEDLSVLESISRKYLIKVCTRISKDWGQEDEK